MCGICGIYNFDKKNINSHDIKKMNDSMISRGPDDAGIFLIDNVGIGNTRLSIIDIKNGHQPMSNRDASITVVHNGEIYNYRKLKLILIKKGYKFLTDTDTEVLIHLYDEYSENMLSYLNGIFSFAIWDNNKKKLFIARDRFGVKPLYYYLNKDKIIFSSSLDSIIKNNNINPDLNLDSVCNFLILGYVPSPETIWKGFNKLAPGSFILIENNSAIVKKYWQNNLKIDNNLNEDKYLNTIKENIYDAIKSQLLSDVEIGCFFSGGIDSSIVTLLTKKISKNPLKVLTSYFFKKNNFELDSAIKISDKNNLNLIKEKIDSKNFFSDLDELILFLDEPFSDSTIVPSFILAKKAKNESLKVILTGMGGDELFGGYKRYTRNYYSIFRKFVSTLGNNICSLLENNLQIKISNFIIKCKNPTTGYVSDISGINISLLNLIIKDKSFLKKGIKLIEERFVDFDYLNKIYGSRFSGMILDLNNYLPDNILAIADKMSMANSVELRVPFLDYTLVNNIFNVPQSFLKKKNGKKDVLATHFSDLLSSKQFNLKKQGFNSPLNLIIKENYDFFINAIKNFRSTFLKEIINISLINKLIEKKIVDNHYNTFFMLLILDKWLCKYEK
jgi:asparagine synthase (glutamine-hydrolysing)